MIESEVFDLEFQSGQCHFGSSPRHLLGRIQRELPADTAVSHKCMQEEEEEEEQQLRIVLPGSLTEAPVVESLVAYCFQSTSDRIPEEVLGIDRKLLEASSRCGESSSRPCQNQVGRSRGRLLRTVE